MERVNTVTVIHNNGETVVYSKGYDDIIAKQLVSREIKRHQKEEADRKEWNEFKMHNQNKRLAYYVNQITNITPPDPLPKRIILGVRDGIEFVLACIIVWSEQLGLIEYIGEDKEWR